MDPEKERLTAAYPSISSTSLASKSDSFQTYKWRWVNLFLFCVMSAMQNFLAFTFAPISETVVKFYAPTGIVELFHVNLLNAITLLTAIPLFIWGPQLVTKVSLRTSITFLVITDVIGSILRFIFRNPNMLDYWFVFVGQAIISLGQVVTWAGPTKLSMVWFPDKERPFSTSMASMSNLLGIAVAFTFSPIIVPETTPEEVSFLLMLQMAICCGVSLVTIVLFKSTPPTAPSKSSTLNLLDPYQSQEHLAMGLSVPDTYCGQLKVMFTNRSFMLLCGCFGLGFGFFNGLFTVMNQMMVSQGYTNADVGIFGVILILCGIVGAGISGTFTGRTHRFKETFCGCIFFACFAMAWFAFSVKPDNKASIAASLGFLGFFALAIVPVALEVSVEYSYPIPESTSSGIICAIGNFLAIVLIVFMSALEAEDGSLNRANYVGLAGFVITFFVSLLLGTDYKRHRYDMS